MNKTAFLIPVYKHGATLDSVISSLQHYNKAIIVVDDGNSEPDKTLIRKAVTKYSNVILLNNDKNMGKGIAVNNGIRKAEEMGFTHVFQLDSDGQHNAQKAEHFLELSEKFPDAVICGYPVYDSTIPKVRLFGRKISTFFIRLVTWNFSIQDALIGFRVYPVVHYARLLKKKAIIDSRMGYDPDILTHLCWENVPVVSEAVEITYPKDGISNFRPLRDNLHISLTFARLTLGMLIRIPVFILRKIRG